MLTYLLFSPFLGILLLLFINKEKATLIKTIGVLASLVSFALSLVIYYYFDSSALQMQFVEQHPWIAGLDITYFVGVDGMSILLVMLTTFLTPIALIGTWNSVEKRLKEYIAFVLLL